MSATISDTTGKPWPCEKLDLHVKQRIREQAKSLLVIEQDDDDVTCAQLRKDGEDSLWAVVQQAIADAGWQIRVGDPA